MAFRTVPGVRRGATLFTCDDGFYYRYISVSTTTTHYTCYRSTCSSRMCTALGGGPPTTNNNYPGHDHDPEPLLSSVFSLRDKIVSRAERESLPLKTIFDEECSRVPVDVAKEVAFGKIENTLQKCRRKTSPPLPTSAQHYAEMLELEEWSQRFAKTRGGKLFFRGNIVAAGYSNLVFISENVEELVSSCNEFHIDGTFKTVPSVNGLKQLLVVMAVTFNHAFPVCFVLMEKRNTESYRAIFQFMKGVVSFTNINHVISDFEKAILRAVREEFPDVDISGCWWHYANCILKRVKHLRLIPLVRRDLNVKRIMHMCMGLALLPPERIADGLGEVRLFSTEVGVVADDRQRLNSLFVYIQTQWIEKVGVDRLSVFNSARRTNNDSESFNMILQREIGQAHPNAWKFIGHLQNIEHTMFTNLERCRNGMPLTRQKRRKALVKDTTIRTASANLEANRLTVVEFLQTVAAVIGRSRVENVASDESEEEDNDLARPPSPLFIDPIHGDLQIEVGNPPDYLGPDLSHYRQQKTVLLQLHSLQYCPPQEFVEQQLEELKADLLEREAATEEPESLHLCTLCLTNKATRLNVPCGHWAGCITCCVRSLDTPTYFVGNLGLEITECRLPMRCAQCSCLVGKLLRVY